MMTYYRLASLDYQTERWIWKTTPLTSLHAMFQVLRIYAALPQDRMRVFTAASKEELGEMLTCENQNQLSGSITAVQFLQERNIQVRGRVQALLEQGAAEQVVRQTTVATCLHSNEQRTVPAAPERLGMSSLDKRRLELEGGAGGAHDSPYTFTLPSFMPHVLAWMKLLSRVQNGEEL